jgi:hypothetical protein
MRKENHKKKKSLYILNGFGGVNSEVNNDENLKVLAPHSLKDL